MSGSDAEKTAASRARRRHGGSGDDMRFLQRTGTPAPAVDRGRVLDYWLALLQEAG
jgi:hypothetical protein